MTKMNWTATANRFICFFDILGFKDLVLKNSHEHTLRKLEVLNEAIKLNEQSHDFEALKSFKIDGNQTKSVTFSDSIIIFSKSDEFKDAVKIIADAFMIHKLAIDYGIPLKGAFSFGQITIDFERSLFFGQPIIDAYLLHEDLQMLTIIADHNFEVKVSSIEDLKKGFPNLFVDYKTNLKSGKITHKVAILGNNEQIQDQIIATKKLYNTVSGRPRIYIDNTIDFLNYSLKTMKNSGQAQEQ